MSPVKVYDFVATNLILLWYKEILRPVADSASAALIHFLPSLLKLKSLVSLLPASQLITVATPVFSAAFQASAGEVFVSKFVPPLPEVISTLRVFIFNPSSALKIKYSSLF
jgi:hypothetical protein